MANRTVPGASAPPGRPSGYPRPTTLEGIVDHVEARNTEFDDVVARVADVEDLLDQLLRSPRLKFPKIPTIRVKVIRTALR